uniref:hydrolase n=1 Tax=Ningiella ruwaisensis TaxID=2364274 RepID=UPI0010A0ACF1|nr:hydrolase [Ningiella ruwaisensis]
MTLRQLNNFSSQFGQIRISDFIAPTWAKNPHIQTIFPKYCLSSPDVSFEDEELELPDGDFLDLSFAYPAKTNGVNPSYRGLVIIFHGLEGSKNSHYVQHLVSHLQDNHFLSVVMHFRGCSGRINRSHRAYHSGETEDAKFVLDTLSKRFPHLPCAALGFSLGGNMLLKLLGEDSHSFIKVAVSVSAPIDLAASAEAINRGFAKRYQAHLLKSMKQNVIKKHAVRNLQDWLSLSASDIKKLKSFREFDEHITSRLHGFSDANDYYSKCSALTFLPSIEIPTLILHAADDPFMDKRVIPNAKHLSKTTAYELSAHGGHVGFMLGSPFSPSLWLPKRILAFIKECL